MNKKLIIASALVITSQCSLATIDVYSTNVPDDAFPKKGYKELMGKIAREENEQLEKGYLEGHSAYYDFLRDIENEIKYNPSQFSQLKKSITKLKLVPNLKRVPESVKAISFGYEGAGAFSENAGWNSLTEIFKSKSSDLCMFTHSDLKASNGGYTLSEENAKYDVNGKYSVIQVKGIPHMGFEYNINWFDQLNLYTLTCVNKEFTPELKNKIIDFAIKIDQSWS
jgi:hypothetical protein